ncbi:hypothetical protein BJ944DRAFT_241620 [Cunninghamella echinulata]|nr:hypothetical protein BJ944DRAFT_241620 [Cunninghamella echinulata]
MQLSVFWITLLTFMSMVMIASSAPLEARGLRSCYKKARLTFYWIPKEGDKDMSNNGKEVTLSGSKSKTLKDNKGRTIAKVSKTTYEKFQMEGTGLLKNGKMVNLGSSNNVFQEVNRKKSPFGLGSHSNSLNPWTTVAANDIPRGTTLYIKELNGLKLPDGRTHNGCVRVEDESWSFDSCQIDFFALQFKAYKVLTKKVPTKVTVVQKKCKLLNYITSEVKAWAVLNKK